VSITELPVRTWTQPYKEFLEGLLRGADAKDGGKDGAKDGGKAAAAAAARRKKAAAAAAAAAADGEDGDGEQRRVSVCGGVVDGHTSPARMHARTRSLPPDMPTRAYAHTPRARARRRARRAGRALQRGPAAGRLPGAPHGRERAL
jgi:hypothetical protein